MHDGYFTVVGYHGRYTFRLKTQDADARFMAGKQLVGYLRGAVNTTDYTSLGVVQPQGTLGVWKKQDIQGMQRVIAAARFLLEREGAAIAAGKMYAVESGRCYVCNRLLTVPESIAAGIGPVCATMIGRMS